jgi:hypothetical protein
MSSCRRLHHSRLAGFSGIITAIASAPPLPPRRCAKVHRDRLMVTLDEQDGRYGYARHKGYATPEHLAAVERFGYSGHHRRSFRPASLFDKIGPGGEPPSAF